MGPATWRAIMLAKSERKNLDRILKFTAHAFPYVSNITWKAYRLEFTKRFPSCTFAKVSCSSRESALISGTVVRKGSFIVKVRKLRARGGAVV
jgi:hypothetical protein